MEREGAKDNRKVCVCWGVASYPGSPRAEKRVRGYWGEQAYNAAE